MLRIDVQRARWHLLLPLMAVSFCAIAISSASAQRLRLDDGRILVGKFAKTPGIIDKIVANPDPEGEAKPLPIVVVDDGLRRTFVPKLRVQELMDPAPEQMVRLRLVQPVAHGAMMVGSVGPSLGITSFDKFGRRIYEMQTRDGPLSVVQGITQLNHRFAKLEALKGSSRKVVWDTRIATSSIPKDVLKEILDRAVSRDNPDDWLQIVRLYLQGERYSDARKELQLLMERFPEKQDLQQVAKQLQQLGARRILKEIELRNSAGQYELVSRLLPNFPAEEVSGETLQRVREMIGKYEAERARVANLGEQLRALAELITDTEHRSLLDPIVSEIVANLSQGTVDRLVPFGQLYDDDTLTPEQRVALAVTGWLLGGNNATQELSDALSLITIREGVVKYLREPMEHLRIEIMDSIATMKGAEVEKVAELLAHIQPPWDIPEGAEREFGTFELTAVGRTEHGNFRYLVQLPPEYDPYRHYPTIVALNGAFNSPEQELNFWAGTPPRDEAGQVVNSRSGQAMRHGYITIAVDWQKPQQHDYEYSLREHEAVLTCLRDARRRFGIDTDRVFVSGHGIGGEAAWDFGQAHTDVWAGVVPFVAVGKLYTQHYWENMKYVPMYFVAGELDGKKMSDNEQVLNKYFKKNFEVTLVEYHGRGHEPFNDEIQRLFDWMSRHARTGPPEEFSCSTMRPWDNFFWWIEGHGFEKPVYPQNWPKSGARPSIMEGKIPGENTLFAKSAAKRTTIWLGPEFVDFSKPISVSLNNRRVSAKRTKIEPQLEVLLEDVRTRADRLKPFWAKLEVP